MGKVERLESTQQKLGRRLGLEPYYVVAARSPSLLHLQSRPEANRATGLSILAGGVILLLIATVVAISGLTSAAAGAGFSVAALAAVVAGLVGGLGYQRSIGGYAVLTTSNSIICDAEAAMITFQQRSAVGTERSQELRFSAIDGLRLRRRPLATGWPMRQIRPIVAIELVVGGQIWVVDTAADPSTLQEMAEGLSEVLGRPFGQG